MKPECAQCRTANQPGQVYCSKCGNDLRAKSFRGGRRTFYFAMWGQEAQAQHQEMIGQLAERAKRTTRRVRWSALLLAGVVAVLVRDSLRELLSGLNVTHVAIGFVVVLFVGALLRCAPRVFLFPGEYFSIEGTKAHNGKPRCIWCGHVGVYTHGAYADSTKYHDCSGCGRTMYIS